MLLFVKMVRRRYSRVVMDWVILPLGGPPSQANQITSLFYLYIPKIWSCFQNQQKGLCLRNPNMVDVKGPGELLRATARTTPDQVPQNDLKPFVSLHKFCFIPCLYGPNINWISFIYVCAWKPYTIIFAHAGR